MNEKQFLDYEGVLSLWNAIKSIVNKSKTIVSEKPETSDAARVKLTEDTIQDDQSSHTKYTIGLENVASTSELSKKYTIPDGGIPRSDLEEDVRNAIDAFTTIINEGGSGASLLTAAQKEKLENLNIMYKTTAEWDADRGFVPSRGAIIIYSDRQIVKDGQTFYVPGLKIGSGNAFVQDLAFIDEFGEEVEFLKTELESHISNTQIHITNNERTFWNNKVNIDESRINDENLIFTRN